MIIRKLLFILISFMIVSCGEKLMDAPENIIAKEKMIEVLSDMAIANSAKNSNITIIRDNEIDPTTFVFKKHGIDSVAFVASDRYYASLPSEYESIYTAVELRLTEKKKELEDAKIISDSLRRIEIEAKRKLNDTTKGKTRVRMADSLP